MTLTQHDVPLRFVPSWAADAGVDRTRVSGSLGHGVSLCSRPVDRISVHPETR